ncbi:MAG TPA: TetR/AcrR family transcriptional regulator [Vibrio sp.]|uniref:TetR/AcrR family transcriptional regulator n=1 Tax=Vibrio TaxID=662 RepID=UPI000480BD39|nr:MULTISPECIES: TetR/AcrR family transcriptional regulator [Vibrio]HCH01296.1 TetR/AcrR family transcriptional regulator [Vibrio sp.]
MVNSKDNSLLDKRQLILNSAEHMIAKNGFQGLSMNKLAQEAGVAAGTIYRYFQDKNDLVEAVRIHVLQRVADMVQQGVEEHMPLKERFILIWKNVAHVTTTQNEVDVILNRIQYESLPTRPSCGSEMERKLFYKIEAMFNEGKYLGVFKPLDNHLLACLSLDVCLSIARKHVLGCYIITDAALDSAIEASWDAVSQH